MHKLIHIMAWARSYYDMGVAMVDCVIVIVYTLHVWGPLELQLFLLCTWLSREGKRDTLLLEFNN